MTGLLLRLFPAEWRARYGAELAELISDDRLTPRTIVDVARAGVRERIRSTRTRLLGGTDMTVGPAWRHPMASALAAFAILMPTMLFVVISILTYQVGITSLTAISDPINEWLEANRFLDLAIVAAPCLALVIAGVPLLRFGTAEHDGQREPSVSIRLRATNVFVMLLAGTVGALLVGHVLVESVLRSGA